MSEDTFSHRGHIFLLEATHSFLPCDFLIKPIEKNSSFSLLRQSLKVIKKQKSHYLTIFCRFEESHRACQHSVDGNIQKCGEQCRNPGVTLKSTWVHSLRSHQQGKNQHSLLARIAPLYGSHLHSEELLLVKLHFGQWE